MSRNSSQWLEIMNDEIKSMKINEIWDLVELHIEVKTDSQGNIERYKA
jgi:hypothetical protein